MRGAAQIVFDKQFHKLPSFSGDTPVQMMGAAVQPQIYLQLTRDGVITGNTNASSRAGTTTEYTGRTPTPKPPTTTPPTQPGQAHHHHVVRRTHAVCPLSPKSGETVTGQPTARTAPADTTQDPATTQATRAADR